MGWMYGWMYGLHLFFPHHRRRALTSNRRPIAAHGSSILIRSDHCLAGYATRRVLPQPRLQLETRQPVPQCRLASARSLLSGCGSVRPHECADVTALSSCAVTLRHPSHPSPSCPAYPSRPPPPNLSPARQPPHTHSHPPLRRVPLLHRPVILQWCRTAPVRTCKRMQCSSV